VNTGAKVRTSEAAGTWRGAQRGRVVFTNGVFDLLHAGHVALLEAARAEGDVLVVGVNSDASVRRLGKGPDRPLVAEGERARVLAALAAVDCVVLFDEDTPLALIRRLRPDVLVKGADYAREAIVGAAEVEGWGGRVVRVPLVEGKSTTDLLRNLRR
jgi:D-beta-D-heptose 7-phosphate kinase/D-beta-D-heptose 1-phosphate adenosyltransferase